MMKKMVILLVATFALSLVAESVFAQTLRERAQERQQERQERLGDRADADAEPGFRARQVGNRFASSARPRIGASQLAVAEHADDTIDVYRRTVCGEYRQVGQVYIGNLEAPVSPCPDHEYILVRTFFRQYHWQLVPIYDSIAN